MSSSIMFGADSLVSIQKVPFSTHLALVDLQLEVRPVEGPLVAVELVQEGHVLLCLEGAGFKTFQIQQDLKVLQTKSLTLNWFKLV